MEALRKTPVMLLPKAEDIYILKGEDKAGRK
jgi:hypothetical protein